MYFWMFFKFRDFLVQFRIKLGVWIRLSYQLTTDWWGQKAGFSMETLELDSGMETFIKYINWKLCNAKTFYSFILLEKVFLKRLNDYRLKSHNWVVMTSLISLITMKIKWYFTDWWMTKWVFLQVKLKLFQ